MSSPVSRSVPCDIAHAIVEFCSLEEVKALSLTCKVFLDPARLLMFKRRRYSIDAIGSVDNAELQMRENSYDALRAYPHLGQYVRQLVVSRSVMYHSTFMQTKLSGFKTDLGRLGHLTSVSLEKLTRYSHVAPDHAFTSGLRQCLLENEHLEDIHTKDSFFFPMDVLASLPSLINLTIEESRTKSDITRSLQIRRSTVWDGFSVAKVDTTIPLPPYLYLPETIQPSGTRSLNSLSVMAHHTDSVAGTIYNWILAKKALNLDKLVSLALCCNCSDDVESAARLVMHTCETLETLTVYVSQNARTVTNDSAPESKDWHPWLRKLATTESYRQAQQLLTCDLEVSNGGTMESFRYNVKRSWIQEHGHLDEAEEEED